MTAELQQTHANSSAQWDLLPIGPQLLRTPEEKARILAHLLCMLAEARAMQGADHADA